jgi:uncharacterized membrane protein YccC
MASKIKEAQQHIQAAHAALQETFNDAKHPHATHLAHVQNNLDAALTNLNVLAENEPEEPEKPEVAGPEVKPEKEKPDVRRH